jgi:integrase
MRADPTVFFGEVTDAELFLGIVDAVQWPKLNFHGLRHTLATLLIAEDTDIREVSGRLGHSNTSTTGDIYAHFLKKADQAAAEKLDNIMTRRKKGSAAKSS